MKLPKISIVIPSFNIVKYIDRTLNSIFSQSYPNLEVIIQDGGSKDGTVEIIKKYTQKYPKIIKWTSEKDKGQVDAINKGLNKATGEIMAFINGDDIYKEGSLFKVGKYFLKHPGTAWLVGEGDIVDKNDNRQLRIVTIYKNILLHLNKYTILLIVNYLTQVAVFLSKDTYKKYGPFWGPKNYVMEYNLWLNIAKDKMPVIVNDYLASFRLTKENKSSSYHNSLLRLDYEIARKYTNNSIILFLHRLNNLARILFLKLIW